VGFDATAGALGTVSGLLDLRERHRGKQGAQKLSSTIRLYHNTGSERLRSGREVCSKCLLWTEDE